MCINGFGLTGDRYFKQAKSINRYQDKTKLHILKIKKKNKNKKLISKKCKKKHKTSGQLITLLDIWTFNYKNVTVNL